MKTNNTNKKKTEFCGFRVLGSGALAKVIANRDSASNEVIVEIIESATFGELRTCFPLVFDGKLTSSNNKEWLKAVFKKEMGPPKRKAKKRSRAYLAELKELNIAVAPKPPSRLFGNHFIKIHDTRLGEEFVRKQRHPRAIEGDLLPGNSVGKRWGIIDTGVDDIHDYRLSGNRNRFSGEVIEDEAREAHYLQSLTGDDTDKEDFVWLSGDIKLGEEIGRRPFKEGEATTILTSNGTPPTHTIYDPRRHDKAQLERKGWKLIDETSLAKEVEITHRVPVLTEANDLGGEMRRAKAAAEEKKKQERLKREKKEKQERLVRDELEKKRKYGEDLRNRTERGEKFEFTPEQLHEIVNNTPEGQRLLQEKKRRLEDEAGGAPREDSRVASLAEKVDEDLVVVDASSVGGEENT